MTDFAVRRDAEGVLHLVGELDLASAEEFLGQALGDLDGRPDIVLDLSELSFLDSSGIRAFLRLAARLEDGIVLQHPQPGVARVLEIVRLEGAPGIRVQS
jgi:anti-anti-sigma factor